MARIHYWTTGTGAGSIVGVHNDSCDVHAALPADVGFIDVTQTASLIPWPPREDQPGREPWSRVVAGALALRTDLGPLPPDYKAILKAKLDAALVDSLTLAKTREVLIALKAWLE